MHPHSKKILFEENNKDWTASTNLTDFDNQADGSRI